MKEENKPLIMLVAGLIIIPTIFLLIQVIAVDNCMKQIVDKGYAEEDARLFAYINHIPICNILEYPGVEGIFKKWLDDR